MGGKEGDGRKGKQGYREIGRSGDREEVAKRGISGTEIDGKVMCKSTVGWIRDKYE